MSRENVFLPLDTRRARISNLNDQIKVMQKSLQSMSREIEDFQNFIPKTSEKKLKKLEVRILKLTRSDADFEDAKARLGRNLSDLRAKQVSPLMPWRYFGRAQRELRGKAKGLQSEILAIEDRLKAVRESLSKTKKDVGAAKTRIQWHKAFDCGAAKERVSRVEAEIELVKVARKVHQGELDKLEASIRPHRGEYDRLTSELANAKSDIVTAKDLDRQLSDAPNSYERAMIHEKCENKFGEGRPRKVISDRQRAIRKLENNIPKLERRIREEFQKIEREITHLLIDGNNVCYEGQDFIGLEAILALLKALDGRFKATVVFDASIRSMLKTDNQGIERALGKAVKTHVAPTRTAADEFILKLAGRDKTTFVLSNDRYAEYHDYDVVKSGRVLRFLIANGMIMANDLDVTTPF